MSRTLGQVIAVERKLRQADNDAGKQGRKDLAEAKVIGLLSEYKPDVEDETLLPPSARSASQYQVVQAKVTDVLTTTRRYAVDAINAVATKDATNMEAKADLVVDNQIMQVDVGISHLLWLEKYLIEWHGALAALPVLSPTKKWNRVDTEDGLWAADPEEVARTTKETVPLVLHPGNDKHPPQVTTVQKDIRTGIVRKTVFSGAIPAPRKQQLLDNCDVLIRAVRDAIARANQTVAVEIDSEGDAIMNRLLR